MPGQGEQTVAWEQTKVFWEGRSSEHSGAHQSESRCLSHTIPGFSRTVSGP